MDQMQGMEQRGRAAQWRQVQWAGRPGQLRQRERRGAKATAVWGVWGYDIMTLGVSFALAFSVPCGTICALVTVQALATMARCIAGRLLRRRCRRYASRRSCSFLLFVCQLFTAALYYSP